jgi:hypothetical protein
LNFIQILLLFEFIKCRDKPLAGLRKIRGHF